MALRISNEPSTEVHGMNNSLQSCNRLMQLTNRAVPSANNSYMALGRTQKADILTWHDEAACSSRDAPAGQYAQPPAKAC